MKLRKRMAAIGAAMVMAVSMMSVGASAASSGKWVVLTAPGVNNKSYCKVSIGSASFRDTVYESCEYYSSSASGTSAKMYTYAVNFSNNVVKGYGLKEGNVYISAVHSNRAHKLAKSAAPTLNIMACFNTISAGTYSEIRGWVSN